MKVYTQKKINEKMINETGFAQLSQLTKNNLVRLDQTSKKTYLYIGKSKKLGFILQDEEDINNVRYIKKDRPVLVGFIY